LSEGDDGLIVEDARGPAARAGVQPGDLILAVNNQRVESVEEFLQAVGATPAGRNVALLVQRDGNTLFIALRPEG
jgi:serine protease Do